MVARRFVMALFCLSAVSHAQPPDVPTDVFDNVVITDRQLQHATAMVQERCPWEINRLYVGLLHVPLEDIGIRYEFKAEVLDTYAICRSALVTFRYEKREQPTARGAAKAIDRVVVGDLKFAGVHSWIERVFPLKKSTVSLVVPDNMTYRQAFALMQTIEASTFKRRDGVLSLKLLEEPIDMSSIIRLTYDAHTDTIRVTTRETRSRGQVLSFAVRGDGFELVDIGFWYA